MTEERNLQLQKCCILLNNGPIQAWEARHYIADHWAKLTENLCNTSIVFLSGRHGKEDGGIGHWDPYVADDQLVQIQKLQENHPEVAKDMEKRKIRFEMIDVHKYYDDQDKLDLKGLELKLIEIDPSILVICICYSFNLDLRFALEGIFARMRLKRDLILTTKGKQITLDPTQKDFLTQLSLEENQRKTVVISGPEGSGKSLLAVEATKMKISSILSQHSGDDRVKIRVILCGAYEGENRVPVLFQFLKGEFKAFERHCFIETKPLADFSVENVQDFQSKIQNELAADSPLYTKSEGILFTQLLPRVEKGVSENESEGIEEDTQTVPTTDQKSNAHVQQSNTPKIETKTHMHTIVLVDELLPKFDLNQFDTSLIPDPNTEFVIAIRHTFNQSSFSSTLPPDKVSILDNTVVCVLNKRLRCSNEITALVFYLLIHSKSTSDQSLKSFRHSLNSFCGEIPLWLELNGVEDFTEFANDAYKEADDVMVIYDPEDQDFSLQPLMKYCLDKKWPCHSYSSIVGSEASTVFIYNLKEFNFEAFTRAITNLVIFTIEEPLSKIQNK